MIIFIAIADDEQKSSNLWQDTKIERSQKMAEPGDTTNLQYKTSKLTVPRAKATSNPKLIAATKCFQLEYQYKINLLQFWHLLLCSV